MSNYEAIKAARLQVQLTNMQREMKKQRELLALEYKTKGLAEGTHVIVPVEQPPIPELPNDMQEFADRHKLGTFIQEVWRQAFRDAHRAMIRAAQGKADDQTK